LRYKLALKREYGDSYFSEEYKAQYNKTYYEDEPNLRQLAKKRLELLGSEKVHGLKLLELGCAAGFFLDEARKLGARAKGYELSTKEVSFAKALGLDVEVKDFLSIPVSSEKEKWDILVGFFVIEHMQDIDGVWERLVSWLRPGGRLLLGLPSAYGPSFVTNPEEWFQAHPKDHFFDYSPRSLKKLLSSLGFTIDYLKPLSYHPNRHKGILSRLPLGLYRNLADFLVYGDTLQILASKKL